MIENFNSRAIKLVKTLKDLLGYQEQLRKLDLLALEYRRERADLI